MDSEKNAHMRELLEAGRPVTDKGPFFHHTKWESYKSGIEGKLGGGLLGAGIGAITGGIAVAGLAIAGGTVLPVIVPVVAGFSAAGLIYGVHEFGHIGKVAGAVAASQKLAEKRMKEFEDSRFDEIKEEIGELKAIVKGETVPEKTAHAKAEEVDVRQDDYRTSHFQGANPDTNKLIFWKVALVGLAVGVIAGAILASGGMAEHILHGLGAAETAMGKAVVGFMGEKSAAYLVSMTALGAIGASFGINRDIFRQIFDQTDLWFRGFVSHGHSQNVLLGKEKTQVIENKIENDKETILYPGYIDYPECANYHREKVVAAGRQTLMTMDTTNMPAH